MAIMLFRRFTRFYPLWSCSFPTDPRKLQTHLTLCNNTTIMVVRIKKVHIMFIIIYFLSSSAIAIKYPTTNQTYVQKIASLVPYMCKAIKSARMSTLVIQQYVTMQCCTGVTHSHNERLIALSSSSSVQKKGWIWQ